MSSRVIDIPPSGNRNHQHHPSWVRPWYTCYGLAW